MNEKDWEPSEYVKLYNGIVFNRADTEFVKNIKRFYPDVYEFVLTHPGQAIRSVFEDGNIVRAFLEDDVVYVALSKDDGTKHGKDAVFIFIQLPTL